MVDALSSVRWKRHQDAVLELSEHGIVLIVEESGCLQAKVYLKRELFVEYEYAAEGRSRFGLSLELLVHCLNTFSVPGHASAVEIRYPGPDMQLLLKRYSWDFAHTRYSGNANPRCMYVCRNQNQNSRYNLLGLPF